MKTIKDLTIKLTIDAREALETLEKVKAELKQISALQEKIAEPGVRVFTQSATFNVTTNTPVSCEEITRKIVENLEKCASSISHI